MEPPTEEIQTPAREGLPTDRRIEPRPSVLSPTVLVVNAHARSAKGRTGELVARLVEAGVHVDAVHAPRKPSQLSEQVRRVVEAGARRVVVAGGDGTISCAAQKLVGTEAVLGVMPLGTANDFARTLGIPDDLAQAAKVIASGHVARVDVGTMNGVPFLNAASVGLSSALTRNLSPDVKRRWGKLAYPMLAISTARKFQPFQVALETDEGTLDLEALQVVVGNGRFHGGGSMVAPEATLEDRRLDFYAVCAASQSGPTGSQKRVRRWRDLWVLTGVAARLRSGRQVEHPWVVHHRAKSVTVRTDPPLAVNVDGELLGKTPVTFGVLPAALRVLVPPRADGRRGQVGAETPK
jgi:YegS/Rv2252/BmrU family lipid kinase